MRFRFLAFLVLLAIFCFVTVGQSQKPEAVQTDDDPRDWSSYNDDVIGSRHNVGERALGKDNVAQLEEKWRFPAKDSKETVGV